MTQDTRRRTVRLLWGTGRWRYAVPVAALAAGLLFGVSASTSQGTDLRPATRDLVSVVQDGNLKVKTQAKAVEGLQSEVNLLSNQKSPGSTQLTTIEAKSKTLASSAGLSPVTGATVTVSLNDSSMDPANLPTGGTLDWLVVHQQDVQGVVNALWEGGATSMMLMDQRVISTSAVRCVGNTLLLQGRVYSPPFTISAMGDPAKLKAALNSNSDVKIYREYVDLVGLGYDVKTTAKATFPAYAGSLTLQYATAK